MLRSSLIRTLLWLLALAPLAGCQQVLFSKLTEPQANEVLAALAETRIESSKERVDDQHWSVSVKSSRLGDALVYLRDRGLPVQPSPTMGEVFKKDGMISTPTEERARYAWALQESIATTLRRIDGVTEARVHVALPQNDPLSDRPVPSTASVFIKHRQTLDVGVIAPQVKSMVMASVEGLDYRNISLFAYPVDVRPVAPPVQRAALVSSAEAMQTPGGDSVWHWFMLGGLSLTGFMAFLYERHSGRPLLSRLRSSFQGSAGSSSADAFAVSVLPTQPAPLMPLDSLQPASPRTRAGATPRTMARVAADAKPPEVSGIFATSGFSPLEDEDLPSRTGPVVVPGSSSLH